MSHSSTPNYIEVGALKVESSLKSFVEQELLPELEFKASEYWTGVEHIVNSLSLQNRRLLDKRDSLQRDIDQWHDKQCY